MDGVSATDNYLSLLLSLPQLSPETVLAVFFLTVARVLPISIQAPFLGAKNAPMVVRMMFALSLVAIFLPQNLLSVQKEIGFTPLFAGYALKELGIGLVLGFFVSAPFYFAQMAGSFIDHQRGSSALQINDPTTQTQTGSLGILYNYTMIVLFFTLGGPFFFFDGLASSYQFLPADQFISPLFFSLQTPFWQQTLSLLQTIFRIAVQLASPGLVGILLTDLFLGIANRMAPQVQIVFLGISLKSWVGIALLTVAWGVVLKVMGKEALDWIRSLNALIEQTSRAFGT